VTAGFLLGIQDNDYFTEIKNCQMDKYIFDVGEFENLDTENDQIKELFFLYGACLGRLDAVGNTATDVQPGVSEAKNKMDQISKDWDQNPDEATRIEVYGELLKVFKLLEEFVATV
jgi:hypothetical protein